jgi:spore coat polysaccharide biosynthesis protein SpsF
MQSKRLPGKSMLPLSGMPLVAHVIKRTLLIEHVTTVILATCEGVENKPLLDIASEMGIESFVGSMENVLERYYLASKKFGGDIIVRVTADNPFTDAEYASMAVDIALESKCDYCVPAGIPLGTAVEVIKKEALKEAYRLSSESHQFEHVTPFIKEHPELFTIEYHKMNFNNPFPNLRLTVDTDEDYELAKILYDNLYKGCPFGINEVIEYLKNNPNAVSINSGVKQRSMRQRESRDG